MQHGDARSCVLGTGHESSCQRRSLSTDTHFEAVLGPMRGFAKRLKPYALGLRRDPASGHLFYPIDGVRHYIRFPEEVIRSRYRRHAFENIYFKHYRPSGRDCVVDIGAGLGTEIIPLACLAPDLRYVAVEIQPWVYECLCLTLDQLPKGFVPFGLAVSGEDAVHICPTRDGVDASTLSGGPVRVETVSWQQFVCTHNLGWVDLLKMNVEGAEADLLSHITLDDVARVIVNVHDFRADRGEGEHFRTRGSVVRRLGACGFRIVPVGADWIYADRGGTMS